MSTSDPNTRTPAQNVKAILARYGSSHDYVAQTVNTADGPRARVTVAQRSRHLTTHQAARLLQSSGLRVAFLNDEYLLVEA